MNAYSNFKLESAHNFDSIMLDAKYNNNLIAKNKYEAFKAIVSQLIYRHDYQQTILNQLIAQERKSSFVFQGCWAIPHLAVKEATFVRLGWFLSPKGVVFQESTNEPINIGSVEKSKFSTASRMMEATNNSGESPITLAFQSSKYVLEGLMSYVEWQY